MKKIINGRKYDTDTAKEMGFSTNGYGVRDFNYYRETLYRKITGEFFLYGIGNAASRYAVRCGSGWSGGERITPFTLDEAKVWAEKHLDAEEYEEIFGEVEE